MCNSLRDGLWDVRYINSGYRTHKTTGKIEYYDAMRDHRHPTVVFLERNNMLDENGNIVLS